MNRLIITLVLSAALSGCDNGGGTDAGTDAGMTDPDSGMMDPDSGPDEDAGSEDPDAGLDAGTADAGGEDAGMIGGGAATSAEITAAQAALDGATTLPITEAIVTYTKPAIGFDPAGFFIQAEPTGPALFVAVDPTTLTPTPAVGSVVSLQIDAMETNQSRREATAISGLVEVSSGNDISFLIQDVSAADDLTTNLNAYESELIRITGEAISGWGARGSEHQGAEFQTVGVFGAESSNLVIRMPSALRASLDLNQGCVLTVTGPMWRFNTIAQPSAYEETDVVVTSCPAPRLLNAAATSLTEVVLQFDRNIDPASITSAAGQFTITHSGGTLAVSDAVASGQMVTLTTATQTEATEYTVTVAETVTDLDGQGVDPTMNSAMFMGFLEMPSLVINEVNANVAGGCDLVELRVTSGGSLENFVVRVNESPTPLFTFPAFNVVADDIVVIHLDKSDSNCRGGAPLAATVDETLARDQTPAAVVSTNYDTAYDFYANMTGLSGNSFVLRVEDRLGSFIEAVAFVWADMDPVGAGSSVAAAEEARMAGQWADPPGGGVYTADNYNEGSVRDLRGTSTTQDGISIQRSDNTDSNSPTEWTMDASSWGAINVGQTPL